MDLDAIRAKLNTLQNTQKKSNRIWKPTPGKHQIRIVPYKFNTDNPFIELYFHYGIDNKTYLSPQSFGRPDPFVEFADALKSSGDKEDWKTGKKMEPKLRTYVPIIVRGEEAEGVKFWGFGKTVYQEILGYIADPDYGDITHPKTGRDLTVEYVSAKDAGTSYPTTTIRVKPDKSSITADVAEAKKLLNEQIEITELYKEHTYDELKDALDKWLNPEGSNDSDSDTEDTPWEDDDDDAVSVDTAQKPANKVQDVDSAFDELFQ